MALAKRLNLTLPHATCVGSPLFGFKQGMQYYDAHHNAVDADGKMIEMEPAPKPQPKKAEAPAAAPFTVDAGDEISDDDELDLRGWANGTVKAPWGTVAAAIQRQYDVSVRNKGEALELISQRLKKSPPSPIEIGSPVED